MSSLFWRLCLNSYEQTVSSGISLFSTWCGLCGTDPNKLLSARSTKAAMVGTSQQYDNTLYTNSLSTQVNSMRQNGFRCTGIRLTYLESTVFESMHCDECCIFAFGRNVNKCRWVWYMLIIVLDVDAVVTWKKGSQVSSENTQSTRTYSCKPSTKTFCPQKSLLEQEASVWKHR